MCLRLIRLLLESCHWINRNTSRKLLYSLVSEICNSGILISNYMTFVRQKRVFNSELKQQKDSLQKFKLKQFLYDWVWIKNNLQKELFSNHQLNWSTTIVKTSFIWSYLLCGSNQRRHHKALIHNYYDECSPESSDLKLSEQCPLKSTN